MIRRGRTVAALALMGLVTTRGARAETCRDVTGTVTTEQTTTDCASPTGICFRGELTSNGWLRGDTFFVVTSAAPSPDGELVYAGVLTVTLPGGAVVTYDTTGAVDPLTGAFVEEDTARDGSSALRITGTTNGTLSAFRGAVTGVVCGGVTVR